MGVTKDQKRKRSDSEGAVEVADVAFPRGGASVLNPLEVKEVANEAAGDVLFESAAASKAPEPARKKPKTKKAAKPKTSAGGATNPDEDTRVVAIERFSFKLLTPGVQVFGQVVEVRRLEVVLALADNLVGYVPITSISAQVTAKLDDEDEDESDEEDESLPAIDSLVSVGQWLRATVVELPLPAKKLIRLTVEPQVVNALIDPEDLRAGCWLQTSVKLVEDHGVVLDTGIELYDAFISNKLLREGGVVPLLLAPGGVLFTAVAADPKQGRTLQVRLVSSGKNALLTQILLIELVGAGLVVDVLVASVETGGVAGRVYGMVDATIAFLHTGAGSLSDAKHRFGVGSTVRARVVGVVTRAGERKFVVSVLPHVVGLKKHAYNDDELAPLDALPVGHVIELATVKTADPIQLFMDVGTSSVRGVVHRKRLDASSSLEECTVGSQHKARVLGYSPVDNTYQLTMKLDEVLTPYLRVEDVPLGEAVVGEVRLVLELGLVVRVFGRFDASVQPQHLLDVKLVYPERKFKVGSKVRGRVWLVDRHQLQLTLKNSLVTCDDSEVLLLYAEATPGRTARAVVLKFHHKRGAVVSFFGNIRAFLPSSEISETFVEDPAKHIRLGQTVKVRVVQSDPEAKRVSVTCRALAELLAQQELALESLVPGKLVATVLVVEKGRDLVLVEFPDSYVKGIIAVGHLSDGNVEQNRALLKRTPVGLSIEACVLSVEAKTRVVHLLAKPLMVAEAKTDAGLLASFEDATVGPKMLHGYIRLATSLGLFVGFANGITGLVLAKYATEQPVADLLALFYRNQLVQCRVIRVDAENKRFLLLLKLESGAGSDNEAAVNPVDKSVKLLLEYVPGKVTKCVVRSIKLTQLNVQLADNRQGRVDATQVFDNVRDLKDARRVLAGFAKGDELKVKVIGFHDARTHRFLPITHRKLKDALVELLARPQVVAGKAAVAMEALEYAVGAKVTGVVNNIAAGVVWLSLLPGVKARLAFVDAVENGSDVARIEELFPVGGAVTATVVAVDGEHQAVSVSVRKLQVTLVEDVEVGVCYPARVVKVLPLQVLVALSDSVKAAAYLTDALDDYTVGLASVFEPQQHVAATVVEVDGDRVQVLLRSAQAKSPLVASESDLAAGQVVQGFVRGTLASGVHVALGRTVAGLARVLDLSDAYLKEWKNYFKVHQPVTAKVVLVDGPNRVLLTLKELEVHGDLKRAVRFSDIAVGDVFEGAVRRATDYGVFVLLDGTANVSGLCHRSEIADGVVLDPLALFGEGDRVKVKVLAVNASKKQLSLGMKTSYFQEGEDVEEDHEDQVEEDQEDDDSDEEMVDADAVSDDEVMGDAAESESDEEASEDKSDNTEATPLGLSTSGFDWTASILDQAQLDAELSDGDLSDDEAESGKRHRKNKVVDRTGDIATRAPQSVGDFERLLVGNPNLSIMWMNFMSFQLQLGDVEKARGVGERALKTINYREEQEKLNIWIAMLNLENTFGSEELLQEVFARGCQYMDPLVMHRKLVGIYVLLEKFGEADALYQAMLKPKKFGLEVLVWEQYGLFLLLRQRLDEAHQALARGLQVLPKRDHVELVRKFAVLEFAKGDPEQGRLLFEGIVLEKPKRADVWNVYIDQEIKAGNRDKAEALLARALDRKLSRKVAKNLFAKWLALAEKHLDEHGMEVVKARAQDYLRQHFESEA